MANRTQYLPGTFSWVELATTDPDAAKRFYGELFGWEFDDSPAGAGVYTMSKLGDSYVGGLMEQMADEREMGVPPHWNNYVTVDAVDESAGRVAELGGKVLAPPFDVMDAGRMAVIQDPTGAVLCLWEAREHPGATVVNEPGAFTWNDLNTGDPDRAAEFYGALFGWTFERVPADEVDYRVIKNGDRSNGGIFGMSQEGVPPHWLPYFGVDSTDDALGRAESLGASKLAGPMDVPAGRFVVLSDPQGAAFALFEGDYDD